MHRIVIWNEERCCYQLVNYERRNGKLVAARRPHA